MVIVIDNRPLHRQAERRYESLNIWYRLVKKVERGDREDFNPTERQFLQWVCESAYEVHEELRGKLPSLEGMNDKLKELLSNEYFKLEEDQISPIDPVTKDLYFSRFGDRVKGTLEGVLGTGPQYQS